MDIGRIRIHLRKATMNKGHLRRATMNKGHLRKATVNKADDPVPIAIGTAELIVVGDG